MNVHSRIVAIYHSATNITSARLLPIQRTNCAFVSRFLTTHYIITLVICLLLYAQPNDTSSSILKSMAHTNELSGETHRHIKYTIIRQTSNGESKRQERRNKRRQKNTTT